LKLNAINVSSAFSLFLPFNSAIMLEPQSDVARICQEIVQAIHAVHSIEATGDQRLSAQKVHFFYRKEN
jgi:hypothetical protein